MKNRILLIVTCLWLAMPVGSVWADAQSDLVKGAVAYETGHYAQAAKWYRKAAKQGHPEAQHNLGWMYKHGRGVTQDYKEAVKWYRKAAKQGFAHASFNLGLLYYKGEGMAQNYKKAAKWYRQAAEQGQVKAQYSLSWMYYHGEGVEQDYKIAYKWAFIGRANGYELAKNMVEELKPHLSPAQIAAAQKEAEALHAEIEKRKGN